MAGAEAAVLDEPQDTSVAGRIGPFLPAVVGALGAWTALLVTGTPAGAVAIYTVYFAAAVVLPGTLLYRRIAGFSDSLLADVAWGSVTGLMLELVGWAAFTAAGVNRFLWVWPALVVLTFVLVPSLRPLWRRPADSGRTSPLVAWSTTVAALLACAYVAAIYYQANHFPPNGTGFFVDLPWHLGVAFEATRSVPLQTPEATAEGTLHYHWFADAHFGAASLISGVDLTTIVMRTGLIPVVFVLVATVTCLAVKITRRPLVGALAGILVVSTTAGAEYWTRMFRMNVVFPESPTGMYSVGISCLLLAFLVDLVRDEPLSKARWVLFAATAVAAVGSKPSVLLLFIPALCLVLGVRLLLGRPPNRAQLIGLGLTSAVFGVSVFVFASPGGSTIDPSLVQVRAWRLASDMPTLVVTGLAKGYLLLAASAVALVGRRLRGDPTAHLLGAVSLVGFVAAWVISHPGRSQMFFWHSAIPFAVILAAWGLALALDALAERRRAVIAFVAVSGVALLVTMLLVRLSTGVRSGLLPGWLALATAAVVVLLASHRLRIPLRTTFLVAVAGVMALSVPVTLIADPRKARPLAVDERWVAHFEATRWVRENTPLHDLLATNSHCVGPLGPHCDARSFWLSGFGGRRVLLGGFGVTPSALRRDDAGGYKAWRQPYHDQALLRLNDGVFEAPDAGSLRRLYHEYGVRWLVADRFDGVVSPLLDGLAELRYANEWIRIYKLDPVRLEPAPSR